MRHAVFHKYLIEIKYKGIKDVQKRNKTITD